MILLGFVGLVLVFCAGLLAGKEWPQRNTFDRVREFHEVFGHPIADRPTLEHARASLRIDLIDEELKELRMAVSSNDLVGIADALGDLDYVVNGAALEYGIPLPEITAEIHRSNMTKLDAGGNPVYREDGKVLKGEGYEPPRLSTILGR